jgi:Pyruvate/2-oxoacid:ferredoxin oxidoreductase gamma subunit
MFDNSLINQVKLEDIKVEKIAIPATAIAKEKLIPRVFNMIILGALAEEIGLKSKDIRKVTLELFKDKIQKKGELKHFNISALEIGEKTIKKLRVKSS